MIVNIERIITERLMSIPWEQFFFSFVRAAGVIFLVWGAIQLLKRFLVRMEGRIKEQRDDFKHQESAKRLETIFQLARQGVVLTMWALGMLMVLKEVGVEIAPVLASAGVLGLAIGFGAQNLVRDLITGFFMILENQVRVGDVVKINGTGGLVERINLRTIIIRDLLGTVHIFPNGTITTVSNMTQEWSAYVFDIGVSYNSDVDEVIQILKDVGKELQEDTEYGMVILEEPEVFGLDKLDNSALIIKGRIKTLPIKQWYVGREFLRRVKHRFDERGIEIPFPQRTLTFGGDLKELLPLNVSRETKKPDC